MSLASPRYRADIDGLRTLAVVPVVLYHAGIPGFGGGFVGVDVFFVISGYLITQLLMADLAERRYTLANFYERRVRRIFPALAVVLASTLALGFAVLDPASYARLGLSAISVTAFASNLYFWRSLDYFGAGAHGEPLLHTWSLAVEEQFYIFYPLLLALFWRRNAAIQSVLFAIAAASLLLAVVLVQFKPSAAFYLLPTRTWELMVGSLLAIGVMRAVSARIRAWAGMAGLAALLLPVLLYTDATPFPGFAAVPPVVGAALLIWSSQAGDTATARLLGWPTMVAIGQASYSLYLWHVPVLFFARFLTGKPLNLAAALALCGVSLVLAFASLRWIERPFRRRSSDRRYLRTAVVLPIAALLGCALLALLIWRTAGWPSRLDPAARRLVAAADDRHRHPFVCMSNGDVIVPVERACHLGAPGATPTVLLWGDSHAAVTATAIDAVARRRGKAFWFAASADCPPGLGFAISETTERTLTTTPSYRFCDDYNAGMLRRALRDPHIATVVLSARWSNWRIGEPPNRSEAALDLRLVDNRGTAASLKANRPIFERGFNRLLATLIRAGKRVIIVGPLPEPPGDVPQALFVERFGLSDRQYAIARSEFVRRHAAIERIFDRVAQRFPSVGFVRPDTRLCGPRQCPLARNGYPLYLDHNHLSVKAARSTAPLYETLFAGS